MDRQKRARGFIGLALLGLTALGLTALAGCEEPARADTLEQPESAPLVRVEVVHAERRPLERRVMGSVVARRVEIASRVAGPVEEVLVELGSHVRTGEPLVRVRDADLRDQSRQARASLAEVRQRLGRASEDPTEGPRLDAARVRLSQSRRELVRVRSLTAGQAVSARDRERIEDEVALAEADLAGAEAEVRGVRESLEGLRAQVSGAERARADATLRAPFDAFVVRRTVEPGQLVAPGTVLLELLEDGPRRVRFELPEELALATQVGASVRVTSTTRPSDSESAVITQLAGALDETRRTRLALAELGEDTALFAGGFVEVTILVGEADLVRVPTSALEDRGGARRVLVVLGDGRVEERLLSVVSSESEGVWVERGVQDGERVILAPRDLRDGDRVSIESPGGAS